MSAHPMRSLKSSVGSKSSSFHAGASALRPSSTARVAADCFVFHQENRSTAPHSSWISRLRPTAAVAAAASIHSPITTLSSDLLPNKVIISTHESRTPSSSFIIRRHLGFAPINPPPPPLPPPPPPSTLPPISLGEGDGRLMASFGPFQVRETRKSAGRGFEKGFYVGEEKGEGRKVGILERKMENEAIGGRISPSVVQFRSRLTRVSAGVLDKGITSVDPVSSSRLQSCFGPWKVESRLKTPVFGPLFASGGSGLHAASRGDAYRYPSDDGSVSRTFQAQLIWGSDHKRDDQSDYPLQRSL